MNKASARFSTWWRRWVDAVAGRVEDDAERQLLGALGVMWCLGLAWAPKAAFDLFSLTGVAQLAGLLWVMSVVMQGVAVFWRQRPHEAVHVLLATVPMVMFCHVAAGAGWRSFSLTFLPALAALAFGVLSRTAAVLVAMGLAVLLLVPYSMPSELSAPTSDLEVLGIFASHVFCFLAVVLVVDVQRLERRRSLVAALADLDALNGDLEAEHAALAAAANRKASFASHLSHEIRGPLLGMVAACEALMERRALPGADLELLEVALRSATDLGVVLGDVFDAARVSAGRIVVLSGPCDVRALVLRVQRGVTDFAAQRGVDIAVDLPPRMTPVRTDGDLLERLLCKLVEHAIRVSDGDVTMRAALWRGEGVTLRVDVLVAVAEPAEQAHRLRLRPDDELASATMVGLGVAIADRLAEVLGGGVDVGLSMDQSALRLRLEVPVMGGSADDFRLSPLGRVLLLSPDKTEAAPVVEALAQAGADVASVSSETEASAMLARGRVDLVLAPWRPGDALLPGMLAALRGAGLLPERVVALVPDTRPQLQRAAMAAGFSGAVPLPLDVTTLRQHLAGGA